jgi:hypothetical protein
MTREELIAKSSEFIQEGFINILLNAFDEGYKKGYNDGKSDQEKSENISHVRFFDFHLPSNTIWATYRSDSNSIYTYNKTIELGLNLSTKEQALELLNLQPDTHQYDGQHHLHFRDIKNEDHGIFYFYQGWRNCPYHYEGLAVWWKQDIDKNNLIEAVVLKYDKENKNFYFALDKISVADNYLTLFVLPKN